METVRKTETDKEASNSSLSNIDGSCGQIFSLEVEGKSNKNQKRFAFTENTVQASRWMHLFQVIYYYIYMYYIKLIYYKYIYLYLLCSILVQYFPTQFF